jgi:hypothetical protein
MSDEEEGEKRTLGLYESTGAWMTESQLQLYK